MSAGRADAEAQMRRLSRRSFAVAGGAAAVGFRRLAYGCGCKAKMPAFRGSCGGARISTNELAESYFKASRFGADVFAPIWRKSRGPTGKLASSDPKFDPARWKLKVELPGGKGVREFSLDQIKSLPRAEMITELKCIEGWSVVVQWAGARLADFLTTYKLGLRDANGPPAPPIGSTTCNSKRPIAAITSASTWPAAMHPQTLLCYELNGKPLPLAHGAPLRLVIPVKYGIKNIKRIGTIRFLDTRPADYWAEQGYDWYAGL